MNSTYSAYNDTPLEAFAKLGFPDAMSYEEYRDLISERHAEKHTTGSTDFDKYLDYSILNEFRMNRLDKTIQIQEDLSKRLSAISGIQHWVLLTESWCGDASQSLPVIAKMAALNEHIHLHIILRDKHSAIMSQFLTLGGRSIPKLIVLNGDLQECFVWGPRPQGLQELFNEYRNSPEPKLTYEELTMKAQNWYNADKSRNMQQEFLELPY
jgi:hypothetical protein